MPSSTDKTTNSSSTSTQQSAYAPQVNDLNTAFTDAMAAYGKGSTATAPTDFTASFSPEALAAFRSMVGYGSNNAVPTGQANAGTSLTNSGVGGVQGALSGYAGFDPSASNNPADLVAEANKYADGQDINSQVNLAMQGAREQARDVTMPGIEQNAAATGNTNSSRTGIADGLVQRGLAEQAGALGGTLRSQAFQNGLTLAQQRAQNNNTAKLTALSGEGALGASSATAGNNASNSSVANMIQQLSAAVAGGQGLTAAQQAELTNQLQKYQSDTSSPYTNIANLMSIISGNHGMTTTGSGTTNEQTETQASPLSIGAGILGAGTSLFGSNGFNLLGTLGKGILSS